MDSFTITLLASSFGGFGTGLSFGGTNAPASSSFSFNAPGFGAQTSTAPSAFGGFGSSKHFFFYSFSANLN